ncbi:MAG TPA: metallophosphoesterase [Longimicrobiales bacterium]
MLAFLIFLGVLAATNVAAAWQLRAIFPRRRATLSATLVVGNLMLAALPFAFLQGRDGVFTWARPILGPPFLLWQVFALGYSAFSLLGVLVWLPLRRRRFAGPWPAFWRRPTLAATGLFAALAIAGTYGALVPLEVRTVEVALPDLPPALDGYRIALLSDLHVGLFTRESRLRAIVERVNHAAPDMVVIAGDLVDDEPRYVGKLARGLRGFEAPDGAYAVLGNHEIYAGAVFELVERREELPFRLLINEAARVERPGGSIALLGLGEPAAREAFGQGTEARAEFAPDWTAALLGARPGDFLIAAAHQPVVFREARRRGIPLALAGHSHGGQFGSRRLGWCLAALLLRWHMGLYRNGGSALYVTTGAGFWVLPVRLGVVPEIAVLVLRSAGMESAGR